MDKELVEYKFQDKSDAELIAKIDKMISESKENQKKIKNIMKYIQKLNQEKSNENI